MTGDVIVLMLFNTKLLRGNVLNTQIYNRFYNKQAEQAFVVLFSFEIYNQFLKKYGASSTYARII